MRPVLLVALWACSTPPGGDPSDPSPETDPTPDTYVPADVDDTSGLPPDEQPPLTGLCSNDGWCWVDPLPHGLWRVDVDGTSEDDIWVVGHAGLVEHLDHGTWTAELVEFDGAVRGVRVVEPGRPCVFGTNGLLACLEDGAWVDRGPPRDGELRGVALTPGGQLWAVGRDEIWQHVDGHWLLHPGGGSFVWAGADDDVWVVSNGFTPSSSMGPSLQHWDGQAWTRLPHAGDAVALGGSGKDPWMGTLTSVVRLTTAGVQDRAGIRPAGFGSVRMTDVTRTGPGTFAGCDLQGDLITVTDRSWARTPGGCGEATAIFAVPQGPVCVVGRQVTCTDGARIDGPPRSTYAQSPEDGRPSSRPFLEPLPSGGVAWSDAPRGALRTRGGAVRRIAMPPAKGTFTLEAVDRTRFAVARGATLEVFASVAGRPWRSVYAFPEQERQLVAAQVDALWLATGGPTFDEVGGHGRRGAWDVGSLPAGERLSVVRFVEDEDLWFEGLDTGGRDVLWSREGEGWRVWPEAGRPVPHPVTGETIVVVPEGRWYPTTGPDAGVLAPSLSMHEPVDVLGAWPGDLVAVVRSTDVAGPVVLVRWDGVEVRRERVPVAPSPTGPLLTRDTAGRSWLLSGRHLLVREP